MVFTDLTDLLDFGYRVLRLVGAAPRGPSLGSACYAFCGRHGLKIGRDGPFWDHIYGGIIIYELVSLSVPVSVSFLTCSLTTNDL